MCARKPRVIDGAALRTRMKTRLRDPWHDLLGQAIKEHALETSDGTVPVDHFIEWLAEWVQKIFRRRQG